MVVKDDDLDPSRVYCLEPLSLLLGILVWDGADEVVALAVDDLVRMWSDDDLVDQQFREPSLSGSTLTVSGKEAGLGDEDQITVQVSATVACVNRGDHNPEAANKQTFGAGADVPVQNGKANYTVTVPINFQPKCSPPMTLVVLNGTVTDVTNGISAAF